jgi:hypothetical protein
MSEPPQDNQTEFVVHPHVILDRDGELLQCLVKATFEWDREAAVLELASKDRQRQIRFADVPWGDPEKSSIAYPADTAPRKLGTDVIVVAKAHPPAGATEFDAYVRVGPVRKALKVFGLRVWQEKGRGLSSPRAAVPVELRYDYAWGGVDDSDPRKFLEEPRNPVGRGITRDASVLTHTVAPCIEDPNVPIQNASTWPPPAGVGAIGRHWEPRRKYTGTYDKLWKEYRSPLPPEDQDDRIHQSATPELIAYPPLEGHEECAFLNMTPGGGALQFRLPRVGVEIEFQVEGRDSVRLRPHLDTVLIDLYGLEAGEPPLVELVWRASVKAPRKVGASLTIVKERTLPA